MALVLGSQQLPQPQIPPPPISDNLLWDRTAVLSWRLEVIKFKAITANHGGFGALNFHDAPDRKNQGPRLAVDARIQLVALNTWVHMVNILRGWGVFTETNKITILQELAIAILAAGRVEDALDSLGLQPGMTEVIGSSLYTHEETSPGVPKKSSTLFMLETANQTVKHIVSQVFTKRTNHVPLKNGIGPPVKELIPDMSQRFEVSELTKRLMREVAGCARCLVLIDKRKSSLVKRCYVELARIEEAFRNLLVPDFLEPAFQGTDEARIKSVFTDAIKPLIEICRLLVIYMRESIDFMDNSKIQRYYLSRFWAENALRNDSIQTRIEADAELRIDHGPNVEEVLAYRLRCFKNAMFPRLDEAIKLDKLTWRIIRTPLPRPCRDKGRDGRFWYQLFNFRLKDRNPTTWPTKYISLLDDDFADGCNLASESDVEFGSEGGPGLGSLVEGHHL